MWRRVRDVARRRNCPGPCAVASAGRGRRVRMVNGTICAIFARQSSSRMRKVPGSSIARPSHGMEEFELYRDLGMLEQVITWNVIEDDGKLPRRSAVLRRARASCATSPSKGDWEGDGEQAAVIAKMAGGWRAAGAGQDQALLSALLALESAGDLSQHAAVVRLHRQGRGRRPGQTMARRSANGP